MRESSPCQPLKTRCKTTNSNTKRLAAKSFGTWAGWFVLRVVVSVVVSVVLTGGDKAGGDEVTHEPPLLTHQPPLLTTRDEPPHEALVSSGRDSGVCSLRSLACALLTHVSARLTLASAVLTVACGVLACRLLACRLLLPSPLLQLWP
jgi:hypothetical protein